mgnify:CR=1 FL=1
MQRQRQWQRQWQLWVSTGLLAIILPVANTAAASGSWVAAVPGMLVTMSDRPSTSEYAVPPRGAPVQAGTVSRVQWRFRHPPGHSLHAWLCQSGDCTALTGMRGSTQAFAGSQARNPLYFRFTLAAGQKPVRVHGMQVIVNYQ